MSEITEEPRNDDILRWRANMKASVTPNVICRWYLDDKKDDKYRGVEEPIKPLLIETKKTKWSCEMPMKKANAGHYNVVLCVSLKDVMLEVLQQMRFHIFGVMENGDPTGSDNSNKTMVPKEELAAFPEDDFVHLRLHRQFFCKDITRGLRVEMDFDLDGDVETQPSFEIHYIQLESNNGLCADSNDHVIYGEGKPDQVVRIKMDTESSVPSINICACAVSVTGSYALTFHQVGKYGSLNIWDLKPNSASKETFNRPQTLNVPCAQATVYLKGINFAVQENMSVNSDISPTGSYAVVAFSGISNVEEELEENPEKKLENRFQAFKWIPKVVAFSGISSVEKKLEEKPEKELEEKPKKKFKNHFQAFKWIRKAPIDQDQDEPWPLKRIETVCDGGGYALSGFCNYKRSEEDKEEERFCTTDGRSFSVHSVQDNWELLYKLEMQPERNTISARTPFASIQGRYFAWSHTTSAISIWDIDTGKLISHIYTDGNQMAKFPVLSRDGSMIAVPVNRKIRIYETSTGIELGVYRKGLPTDDYDNYILFGQGRFMTRNILESTVKENQKYDARSVVRVQDMSIVNSTRIHEDYKMCFRRNGKNPVFSYGCGSVLNILQPGDLLATEVPEEGCGSNSSCKTEENKPFYLTHNGVHKFKNKTGKSFELLSKAHLFHNNRYWKIDIRADHGNSPRMISIPLNLMDLEAIYQAIFFPCSSRLVLSANGKIQVWNLSANESRPCELSLVLRIHELEIEIVSGDACEHSFSLQFKRRIKENKGGDKIETLTVPLPAQDIISIKEAVGLTNGISSLVGDFAGGDKTYKEEVIQYLKSRLCPTLEHQESSLIPLCKAWTVESKSDMEFIIHNLLPADRITWIPDASSAKDSKGPLSIILEFAKTQPSAIYTAKLIMDYCVKNAIRSRNLPFLNPFFRSLYQVMDLVPQEGILQLGRITHISVMNRSHIMDNHIIIHPPKWQFWKQNSTPLYKIKDPIMQLHISGSKPDPANDLFTQPVFMASFDALWSYEPKKGSFMSTKEETRTTWWKILYHLIRLNCRPQIYNFVECYDFNLEFHENPAIAALVAYKWNTIGFKYWLIRFTCQFCFYSLVVIAAFLQVYHKEPSKLVGLWIAIIVMAAIFLWLEFLQFLQSISRYIKSSYNFLDMVSFGLPMAASVNQLVIIYQENEQGNTHLMSFSVLAVFLHMLFELRISKGVCKYVTIIHDAVTEIRIFFIIFAVGIFAFTIATLHLLRACSYEGCEVPGPEEGIPENFFHALSVIYFFMGGRWDPANDIFMTKNWAFHIMMVIFFFFTVILMLNVLIALINKAFTTGDEGWRLVWIESRLRYIESAENLSYHIPGFRQTYDWFPKEIYFSSSLQKVQMFREKYLGTSKVDADLKELEKWIRNGSKMDELSEGKKKSKENAVKESKKNQDEEASSDNKVEELDVANPISDGKGSDASGETENVDKEDATSSSATATITKSSSQIIDLRSQVGDLRKQLIAQNAAQQKQAQQQQEQMQLQQEQAQRQHEEIKSLLSSLR